MSSRCVAFLTTGLSRGGAERQLTHLASRLALRGWRIHVLSMLPPTAYQDELTAIGIEVTSLGMRRGSPSIGSLIKAARYLRARRPDILVTYMIHANLLGRAAGRLAGVPVTVSSIRNEWFGGRFWERAMSLTDWMAAATVVNSEIAARRFERLGIVRLDRLYVIPNGIDLGVFAGLSSHRDAVRHELGVRSDEFLWAAVGRLEPQKDYLTLLRAFHAMGRDASVSRLVIAGAGSQRAELERLVRGRELTQRVQLLGLRSDVPRLLAGADGFVLSSAWEGLPNVVMEAIAVGLPVVATEVGGVPELIEDGRSGILVPARDPQQLACAMRRMEKLTPVEREDMVASARSRLSGRFDLERVVDQWEDLLSSLGNVIA